MNNELSKKERKKLRKYYLKSIEPRNSMKENTQEIKIFKMKNRLKKSLLFTRRLLDSCLLSGNIVLDYSPESLKKIDNWIGKDLNEVSKKENAQFNNKDAWAFYQGLGSYLGEVIIQNIDGEWVFPSESRYWLARLFKKPEILFDHCIINLHSNKIPVIKIAKLRCDGSGRIHSLMKVYDEIASTGAWSE